MYKKLVLKYIKKINTNTKIQSKKMIKNKTTKYIDKQKKGDFR